MSTPLTIVTAKSKDELKEAINHYFQVDYLDVTDDDLLYNIRKEAVSMGYVIVCENGTWKLNMLL